MTIRRISSGGIYEKKIGYCRAVVAGGFVHVSGTTAQANGPGKEIPDDVVGQLKSALEVITCAFEEAGSSLGQVVRVHYILPNASDFVACWPLLSETFGDNPPAATMIEAGLIDPKYKIEIEVTALAGGCD